VLKVWGRKGGPAGIWLRAVDEGEGKVAGGEVLLRKGEGGRRCGIGVPCHGRKKMGKKKKTFRGGGSSKSIGGRGEIEGGSVYAGKKESKKKNPRRPYFSIGRMEESRSRWGRLGGGKEKGEKKKERGLSFCSGERGKERKKRGRRVGKKRTLTERKGIKGRRGGSAVLLKKKVLETAVEGISHGQTRRREEEKVEQPE